MIDKLREKLREIDPLDLIILSMIINFAMTTTLIMAWGVTQ